MGIGDRLASIALTWSAIATVDSGDNRNAIEGLNRRLVAVGRRAAGRSIQDYQTKALASAFGGSRVGTFYFNAHRFQPAGSNRSAALRAGGAVLALPPR